MKWVFKLCSCYNKIFNSYIKLFESFSKLLGISLTFSEEGTNKLNLTAFFLDNTPCALPMSSHQCLVPVSCLFVLFTAQIPGSCHLSPCFWSRTAFCHAGFLKLSPADQNIPSLYFDFVLMYPSGSHSGCSSQP